MATHEGYSRDMFDAWDIGVGRGATAESIYGYLHEFRRGQKISVILKNGKSVSGKYIKHTRGHLKIKGIIFTRIISLRYIESVSSFYYR